MSAALAFADRFPIGFVLLSDADGGTCGLTTTITGQGAGHFVLRLSRTGFPVGFTFSADGTAAGADGSTYVFNDAAVARNFDGGFFNPGWSFDMVDHFNLIGHGSTIDLRAYVRGRLVQNADGEFEPVGSVTIRGEECDPDLPLGG